LRARKPFHPLKQSVPRLTGCAFSGATPTILPPSTSRKTPQPHPQKPQVVSTLLTASLLARSEVATPPPVCRTSSRSHAIAKPHHRCQQLQETPSDASKVQDSLAPVLPTNARVPPTFFRNLRISAFGSALPRSSRFRCGGKRIPPCSVTEQSELVLTPERSVQALEPGALAG
jgi:hypothetical protein